ncbi:MAG: hypothetical protein O4807_02160 [Trichodesmium sp. St19_bin2]|nr:hypothetical protein [Trichodesmium sp. St19_bin2]
MPGGGGHAIAIEPPCAPSSWQVLSSVHCAPSDLGVGCGLWGRSWW